MYKVVCGEKNDMKEETVHEWQENKLMELVIQCAPRTFVILKLDFFSVFLNPLNIKKYYYILIIIIVIFLMFPIRGR